MKVLFEYSEGCQKHINQDCYGYKDNIFWVIDGATDVFGKNYISASGDVYWVVQQLNQELHNGDTSLALKEYVRSAIDKVNSNAESLSPLIHDIPPNFLPTYSICCVRYEKNLLEYLCLGDCSVFVSNSPLTRYTDERIYPFHLAVNKVKNQYCKDVNLYHTEVLKKVREIKQYINIKDGYWIGTLDANVIDHAIFGKISIQPNERFLICSDGFRPSIDESQLVSFNPNEIFNIQSLQKILKRQNISESDYYSKTGIDISDDKTVLLIKA